VLSLVKFMLDAALELRGRGRKWIEFHPATIIHYASSNHYRFLALPHCLQAQQAESYFSPERYSGNTCLSEQSTVFSIGMVLLSVLLREDCSDCYNQRTPAFCRSLFEHKLRQLQERAAADQIPALLEHSSYGPSPLQNGILALVYALTAAPEDRISLAEGRRQYNGMLQQLSDYQIKPTAPPRRNCSVPSKTPRMSSPPPLPRPAALHFQNMLTTLQQSGSHCEPQRMAGSS
jgi:hypothetical protein